MSSPSTPEELHIADSASDNPKRNPTQRDFDLAFDEMAYFLLEEYRKHKETSVTTTEPNSNN